MKRGLIVITAVLWGSASAALADSLLEVCGQQSDCIVKHRYQLRSVCELDRASEANRLPAGASADCVSPEQAQAPKK